MSYRFQQLTTYYAEFINCALRSLPGDIEDYSYAQLLQFLNGWRFGWSDVFSTTLKGLGHVAEEVYSNVEPLQKKWAAENNFRYDEADWSQQILLERVRRFQPNLLFLDDLYGCDREFREHLRSHLPKHCKIIGWRSAPTVDFAEFDDLDLEEQWHLINLLRNLPKK